MMPRPRLRAAPWPILALIASLLAASEMSLYIGGLRLPPHRLVLLALIVPAAIRLLTRRDIRLRSFDWMFLFYNVWTVLVFVHHGGQPDEQGGQSDGLVFGGSLAVESFGGYLVARAWIRDAETFRASIAALVVAIAVAGLVALPETIVGQHISHDLLQSLTGHVHPRRIETRLGLTRAFGTFDHPIHLGTVCSSIIAMAWYAERRLRRRIWLTVLMTAATLTALSSAPLLGIGLQLTLIGWDRATRGLQARVALTLAAMAGLFIGASLVSNRSPFSIIATGFTLDSWTGYYRLMIWQYGFENVWNNALIGIGLRDWARPDWMVAPSVDAFWLVIAMRGGMPAFFLLFLAYALLVGAVVRRQARQRDARMRRLGRGWLFSVLVIALVGCTVHYWNVPHTYFFLLLGMGAWLADPKPHRLAARVPDRVKSIRVSFPGPLTAPRPQLAAAN